MGLLKEDPNLKSKTIKTTLSMDRLRDMQTHDKTQDLKRHLNYYPDLEGLSAGAKVQLWTGIPPVQAQNNIMSSSCATEKCSDVLQC